MNIANISIRIDNAIHRHTPKFKEIDLLPIHFRDAMLWVWHSNERNLLSLPIALKRFKGIGTYSKEFCAPFDKAGIDITEARQLRAAVKSHKSA